MKKDQCIEAREPEPLGAILARLMEKVKPTVGDENHTAGDGRRAPPEPGAVAARQIEGPTAYFDFDLAEFPLFSFAKRPPRDPRAPLTYADTIRGKDGRPVARTWTAYPGRLGVGGATAHELLFDLLQLYAEQGGRGAVIHFGTLRSLFLRRGERNPSKKDYDRVRRDFAILRGYDFSCKNAFWDSARRAYVDMDWRLFGAVYYFKATPAGGNEQPHGFIELSPTFRSALQARGLFRLGFDAALFHRLPPLGQRLAVYLAKVFTYQAVHRRRVEDLARLLPIQAATASDARKVLLRTAARLLELELPILEQCTCDPARHAGLVTFRRGASRSTVVPRRVLGSVAPPDGLVQDLVERIVETVRGTKDRVWWERCVGRLGPHAAGRALGQLREAILNGRVHNPGGLLTKIFKDIARDAGVRLDSPRATT